jgi:hypothetical protein
MELNSHGMDLSITGSGSNDQKMGPASRGGERCRPLIVNGPLQSLLMCSVRIRSRNIAADSAWTLMQKSTAVPSAPISLPLPDRSWIVRHTSRYLRLAMVSLFLFSAAMCVCQTPAHIVLCNGGDGIFDGEFRTGVKVHVGAARNKGLATLATRACAAKLTWEKQELVVATGDEQLDLDAFGVDLGDRIPVAAFQIKKTDADCCMEYAIYSLEKPPRLLRTITGGEFFSASDRDLDGSVEIWTQDAVAVNGFESLTLSELDFPPSVVFRFAHGRLIDASAEFQPYFDDEITKIRTEIHAEDLQDFKRSDGKLTSTSSVSLDRSHQLRVVKIRVLEIVWAYLYSGREQDAWRSLAEMWPSTDVDRIRAAIVNARAHGIRNQGDGTSSGPPHAKKKHARVFDAVSRSGPGGKLEVVPPQGILMQRPPVSEIQQHGSSEPEKLLDLVVDEAGKVRSAEPAGNVKWVDPELINAALTWKFIPAFKDGRAVASRQRLAVSPRQ